MNRVLTALLPFLLLGCVSPSEIVPPEMAAEIPEGDKTIRVYLDSPADSAFARVHRQMEVDEYRIQDSNPAMGMLTNEYTEVGMQTTLQMRAFVRTYSGGSVVLLCGLRGDAGTFDTGMGTALGTNDSSETSDETRWEPKSRAGVAFGRMVQFARSLPGTRVEYVVN